MSETPVELPPMDAHNTALIDHVHPGDWMNPEPAEKYNLVVIGAGTAGLVAAAGAAGLGAKVALIERHLMGGDCLNVGCVPSKGLISAGRVWQAVRDAADFGVQVPDGASVDFAAVMERMRRLRARIAPNDSVQRFSDLGVDVFLGGGRFVEDGVVEVAGTRLNYAKALIATGGRATAPPIEGLADAGYLTHETLFSLTELPRRLAVIGGGPIGSEMAQAMQRFGCQVTLLEAAEHVLVREDSDAARVVQDALIKDGVDLRLQAKVRAVHRSGDEKVVHVEIDGKTTEVAVDDVLVAVGRSPNVEGLGLEDVGVDYERYGVTVDDHLRTTNSRIFAAGDVCYRFKFTHTADFLARIVIRNALFGGRAKASDLVIPWCTYTQPELAHVGLSPSAAAEQGIEVDTYTAPLDDVDRAILDGHDEGFARVHVKKGTDTIVGATIVADHAGEMISELSVALVNGVGLGKVANTIHPYPTQAEVIRKLGDQYNRTRLTPRVAKIMGWILRRARR